MKLSLIVPVYNAEKYIHKCLESIIFQQLDEKMLEVIVINDGSTDRSLEIAESFQQKINNYTIISHENQGESASRNLALSLATGQFITFLDSDDFYETNTLNTALEIIERDDLDILYLRLKQVDENGSFIQFVFDLQNEEVSAQGLEYDRRPFPATIYRREIIGNITFPLGILVGPDSVFNAMVQAKAARVSFTRKAVYNYTYRSDSLSKQGNSDKAFQGFIKAVADLRTFQNENFKNNKTATKYFEKVYEIFITRIIELNILPTLNREKYNLMVSTLKANHLSYILKRFETKYPGISTYYLLAMFQKYLNFKSTIHLLLHKNA